jgi:hypothetical protein
MQDMVGFLIDNFINKGFVLQEKQETRFLLENGFLREMGCG